jgi:hypothetical protein
MRTLLDWWYELMQRKANRNKRDGNEEILCLLRTLLEKVNLMAGEVDRVLASVTNIDTKVDSLIALANQLAQLIRDNANNPKVLTQIADDLDAKAGQVQAAVDANTPPTA